MATARISARALKDAIGAVGEGTELALLDVREEGVYAEGHLLFASACPLSRLELLIRDLVPRYATPLVVMDAGEGLAQIAADRLRTFGYADVRVLDGGIGAWAAAGFEIFGGMNVPSKAFGELVEARLGTPHVSAHQLKIMMDRGDDLVVLDSRPMDEFRMMNIPGALDCPVSELVYRINDIAPDPGTRVVVNCAGRTRSIVGAQSLINAGVPNDVVALENGTMGWHLAGYEWERNATRMAPDPSPEGLALARERADRVAARAGVREIDRTALDRFRAEADTRTLYVFDVRLPEEYAAAHLEGSRPAIGVQLTQKTDSFMATLGARVVVVDDTGPRARMCAAWLRQMGWGAHVLAGGVDAGRTVSGAYMPDVPGQGAAVDTIAPRMMAVQMMRGRSHLIDLSRSLTFARGHIPGARFAIRARLGDALSQLPPGDVVLTSEDGTLARLAAPEVAALGRGVKVLAGGNAAWRREKLPWETGRGQALAPLEEEAFWRPYERESGQEEAMEKYLAWEHGLIEQIERDGDARFNVIDFSKD